LITGSTISSILFNSRSLLNKLDQLQFLLHNNIYDLLFISETWLSKNISDSLIIQNSKYNIVRADRSNQNKKGGGVCMLINYKIPFTVLTLKRLPFEILCVDIYDVFTTKKHRLILIYRPPSMLSPNDNISLIDTLSQLCSVPYPTSILGDLNYANIS